MKTAEKFWARVNKTDSCWLWTGAKTSAGYGVLLWRGDTVVAHRVSALLSGLVVSVLAPTERTGDGFVLHKCDVRLCVNPSHLEIGTLSKNQADSYIRNRRSQPKGELHANAKLSSGQVVDIRKRYAEGEKQIPLAEEYGVSQRTISLIIRGLTYRDRSNGGH